MSKKAQSDSHGGENRGYRRNANQLHEEIGHNRAGNAEQIVHPAVCRVVERRIARRPGDQRRRQPPAGGESGYPYGFRGASPHEIAKLVGAVTESLAARHVFYQARCRCWSKRALSPGKAPVAAIMTEPRKFRVKARLTAA